MGDELSIYGLALDIPDGACGVDGRCSDATRVGIIPVEGGERAAEVAVAVAVELAAQHSARLLTGAFHAVAADGARVGVGGSVGSGVVVVRDAPDAEEVGGGGEQIGADGLGVRDEHGLGGRERVVEGEHGGDVAGGLVELDHLDAVDDLFQQAGDGEAVLLVAPHAPVHAVDVPRGLVGVDLRPLRLRAAAASAVALLLIRPAVAVPDCAAATHVAAALLRGEGEIFGFGGS